MALIVSGRFCALMMDVWMVRRQKRISCVAFMCMEFLPMISNAPHGLNGLVRNRPRLRLKP